MIQDSYPWKQELKKTAKWLKALRLSDGPEEKKLLRLEKALFFSAYAIRKLKEANKLTDCATARRLKLEAYPVLEQVTLINCWKWPEVCDQNASVYRDMSILELCHQLVHSFVFSPVFDEKGALHSVVVASDRQRRDVLLCVTLTQLLDVLESVASDVVRHIDYRRDDAGKETIRLS